MQELAQGDIRRERINSLSGLKVIALATIFCWHTGVLTRPDLGGRMVEFFFACSGILEAVRHYGTYSYTLQETYENFKRRLRKMYPVHIVTFVLAIVLGELGVTGWVLGQNKIAAVLELFMLQVWDAKTMFAFNGVSWFLCDLLVCYAFTPFMSYVVQRAREKSGGSWRRVWLMLALTIVLRALIDLAVGHGTVAIAVHTFPPVRLLDYFMAYVCGCLLLAWRQGRGPVAAGKPVQTAVEVAAILLYVWLINVTAPLLVCRTLGMVFATGLVLTFVLCRGWVSSFFSAVPFRKLAGIELEFYMVHELCVQTCNHYIHVQEHWIIVLCALALALVMTFVVRAAVRGVNALVAKLA